FELGPDGSVVSATRQVGSRDAVHDVVGSGVERYQYSLGSQLTKVGSTTWVYDACGRLVAKRRGDRDSPVFEEWQFEWNAEGWLSGVRTPRGDLWSYAYDPFGRRIRKTGPSGSTTYVWDGDLLVHERTSDGDVRTWTFEPDCFAPMAQEDATDLLSFVVGHSGEPCQLISSTNRVVWSAEYSAWGETVVSSAADQDLCAIRYPGQWFDEESGLCYNRFRYYDSSVGRYLSPDPTGLYGGGGTPPPTPNPP